uniref:SAM-dependent MTase RsmB/NOP-type domain-containing protein n=2 Tax=Gasterosteus aculeatus aculeatus TaxID=481459 RepID=G3PUW1_GASAC|nr:putative methyltransferase NSUN7 isoform X1 [Gasterosteus aculeatus aculeatus]
MTSVAPVRRILDDTAGPGEDHKVPPPIQLHRLQSQSPASPPSDQTYLQAAAIFHRLRTEKPVEQQLLQYGRRTDTPPPPPPESGFNPPHRLPLNAYQLAFDTLKYQDLLEETIAESCFQTSQNICGDSLPLAMVMLFDYQDRRFFSRKRSATEEEQPSQEVRDMEGSLQRRKTKLAATLARYIVKHRLQGVSCFLSEGVRTKQQRAKLLPVYAWVNTLQTSVEDVCAALRAVGLREVELPVDLTEETFCRDPLCPDTLVFSRQLHSSLTGTEALNAQDRSLCVAVSALRPLLVDKGDVLVAGSFSAVTVAHVAVAAAARSGRALVCGGDHTAAQLEEMRELLEGMDIKNARVLSEAFCGLGEGDAAVQRLKVILVLPQCSSSALSDPVPTIHSEHGAWDLLPDLCHESVSRSKIHKMANEQARLLAHALCFPKVQTVVYCTRSVYPEENEQLVKRVLEKTHTHPKLLPFRLNGPIFPDDSGSGVTTDSRFLWIQASQFTNGCFVARLSRQADPTKVETIHDVLARAAAKGLLGGILPEQSKPGKRGKRRKNGIASAGSKPSSPSSQERQTGSNAANGEDPDAASEHNGERGECGEEGKEGERGGKCGKKKKLKGTKHKAKGQTKGTNEASKQNHKSRTKKSTKTNVNQSHVKRQRPRRIPRLTLSLMSSSKSSNHLHPITALAHKLRNGPTIKSQQADLSGPSPGRPKPTAASKQVHAGSGEHHRAEGRRTEEAGPKVKGNCETVLKPPDSVLPPICSPSHGSVSASSLCLRLSRTSLSQAGHTSASSSSVDLPRL